MSIFTKYVFGFFYSKNLIEIDFFKGMVRVDGERVGKKSMEVVENNVIDLIKGFNIENREHLDIVRVKILKIDDKASSGRINFVYQKTNSLTIVNYEKDPFTTV